jgi:hypothetical protein
MAGQWCILAALVFALLSATHSAHILGVFPIPAKSHNIILSTLTNELARRGHQVTVITSFPQKTPIPNLTDIEVPMDLKDDCKFAVRVQKQCTLLTEQCIPCISHYTI